MKDDWTDAILTLLTIDRLIIRALLILVAALLALDWFGLLS